MIINYGNATRTLFENFCRESTNADISKDVWSTTILGTYRCYVDPDDKSITPHLIKDGYWEMWITQFMLKRFRIGMNFMDIGANYGYYTLPMADVAGVEGTVIAVEPQPRVFKLLMESVEHNGFDNVALIPGVVTDESGWTDLMVPDEYLGAASMNVAPPVSYHTLADIPAYTADELMELYDLEKIDFMKIDAEGEEEKIWVGMEQILKNPDLQIVLEFSHEGYNDPEGFFEALKDRFKVAEISTKGTPIPVDMERLYSQQNVYLYLGSDYDYRDSDTNSKLGLDS